MGSIKKDVKDIELCAVSKEIAVNKLNSLVKDNPLVFAEYDLWVAIINSPIKIVSEENQSLVEK